LAFIIFVSVASAFFYTIVKIIGKTCFLSDHLLQEEIQCKMYVILVPLVMA
jgi:hypothetical protein